MIQKDSFLDSSFQSYIPYTLVYQWIYRDFRFYHYLILSAFIYLFIITNRDEPNTNFDINLKEKYVTV